MVKDGALHLDFEDEVTKATVITHNGQVVSEPVRKLLDASDAPPASPIPPSPNAPSAPRPEGAA
jgi:hypothetical protein